MAPGLAGAPIGVQLVFGAATFGIDMRITKR